MLIRKSEEEISYFLKKYQDYENGMIKAQIKLNQYRTECQKNNVEIDEKVLEKLNHDLAQAIVKDCISVFEDSNQESEDLDCQLNYYTLDMLVELFSRVKDTSKDLAVKIELKIRDINSKLKNLNELELVSGAIFFLIEDMTEEEKRNLLELNEQTGITYSISSVLLGSEDIIQTQQLNDRIRILLEKSFDDSFEQEKIKYFAELGIETEEEMLFYVSSMYNQKIAKDANEIFDSLPIEEGKKKEVKEKFLRSQLIKTRFRI